MSCISWPGMPTSDGDSLSTSGMLRGGKECFPDIALPADDDCADSRRNKTTNCSTSVKAAISVARSRFAVKCTSSGLAPFSCRREKYLFPEQSTTHVRLLHG